MTFPSLATRAWRGLAAAVLSAGLLAACGGSTSRVDAFVAKRLVVFGDEYSTVYDPKGSGNGSSYSMNGLLSSDTTNNTLYCASSYAPWTQQLATTLGLYFKECNPQGYSSDNLYGFMQAKYGATVRAVVTQVDDFQANIAHDALGSKDLVTLMVGLHDIIELYKDNLTFSTEDQKLAEAETRGRQLAALANRMAGYGAKVLIAQELDVGLTPYALSEGTSEAALLTRITNAFNKGIRLDLLNDGSKIGLLAFDDAVRSLVKRTANVTDSACDADHVETVSVVDDNSDNYIDGGGKLLGCTTATKSADDVTKYLWADPLRGTGNVMHSDFYGLAYARYKSNPF